MGIGNRITTNRAGSMATIITLLAGWVVVLVACSGGSIRPQNSENAATNTSQPQLTSTTTAEAAPSNPVLATSTHDIRAISTPTLTMVPRPSYPEILRRDFIFSSDTSGCKLPCWGGLTVGRSNVDDTQNTFRRVLGFDERINILDLPRPEIDPLPPIIPDELVVAQVWGISESGPYRELSFRFDRNTRTLRLITFFLSADFDLSPQRVIEELGTPSFVRAGFIEGQGGMALVYFQMIYDNGVVFYYDGQVPITYVNDKDHLDLEAELCMDSQLDIQIVTIMEPLQSGLLSLTSFQERAINDAVTAGAALKSVEDVFGITPEQLAQRVRQEPGVCFSSRWPLQ